MTQSTLEGLRMPHIRQITAKAETASIDPALISTIIQALQALFSGFSITKSYQKPDA